jgi:hypothetical protein
MPVLRGGKKRDDKKRFLIEGSDKPHAGTRPGSAQLNPKPVTLAPFTDGEVTTRAPRSEKSLAGWHRDPTHRHEFRFFDGACWTANVMDGRAAAIDPIASVSAAMQAPSLGSPTA